MSLAILVAYLLAEEDGDLLRLHLRQIERHTRSPFTIHAALVALPPLRCERASTATLGCVFIRWPHRRVLWTPRRSIRTTSRL